MKKDVTAKWSAWRVSKLLWHKLYEVRSIMSCIPSLDHNPNILRLGSDIKYRVSLPEF